MSRYQMNPGELRHFIVFQEKSKYRNEFGEEMDYWEDVLKARAGIYPISGKEFFAAEKVNSEITHKIRMRYVPGVKPDMRIKFGERIFEQKAPPINFQERNVELQLLCRELI